MNQKIIKELLNSQASRRATAVKNTNRVKKAQSDRVSDNSRSYFFAELKRYLRHHLRRNLKLFAVKIGDPINENNNLFINYDFSSMEGVEFSLSFSGKFSKKDNRNVKFLLIGIRSVIGYNPFLIDMVETWFSEYGTIVDISEINSDKLLAFFLHEIDGRHMELRDYIFDSDNSEIKERFYSLIKKRISEEKKTDFFLLPVKFFNKKIFISEYLTINNKEFDEKTVVLAKALAKELGILRGNIVEELKARFPEQLDYIDLEKLFEFYKNHEPN